MEQNDIPVQTELDADKAIALMIEVEEIFEAIRHGEMEGELFEF